MPRTDMENLEVDFSRAKDGLRRYWPIALVTMVLMTAFAVLTSPSVSVAEAELRFSDNRARLSQVAQLANDRNIVAKYGTGDFRKDVEQRAGAAISFTFFTTDQGLIGVSAQGPDAEAAERNLDVVEATLNEALRDEEQFVASERAKILEATLIDLQSAVAEIRSESNSDSEVSEILERTSLIGLVAAEQQALSTLRASIAVQSDSLIEVRREFGSTGAIFPLAMGVVGGAVLGVGIAVVLGFIRRRIADGSDMRRITGTGRVLEVNSDMSNADLAAVALGLLRLRSGGREPASLHATGERSRRAATAVVEAAQRTGLPLSLATDGEPSGLPAISLAEPAMELDSLLTLSDDVLLIATASVGERLDDLMSLTRRLDSAGYEPAAALLIS